MQARCSPSDPVGLVATLGSGEGMGAAVAAVILMKERQLIEVFTRAGATTPERAQSLESLQVHSHGVAMRRLRERAIVRESAPGLFYADLEVWQALRRTRRRILLVLAVVILAVALVFVVSGSARR